MIKQKTRIGLLALCLGVITVSCEKDAVLENIQAPAGNQIHQSSTNVHSVPEELVLNPNQQRSAVVEKSENLGEYFRNAVEPSECGPTELSSVQNKYIYAIIGDPYALANNGIYSDLNYYYSYYLNDGEQYFGADGDYTKLMIKRQRELNTFWNLPVNIAVKGQHTATLNDRDKVAEVFFEFYGFSDANGNFVPLTQEQAYQQADIILQLNELSPNLPENPYFASDGFASFSRTIVIGDGLPTWLAETGLDEGIVWTGILSHEYAHEVQFFNYGDWYPAGPENTRYTELEADFFAAYFMTHKRGATYNWKRVEEFFKLYFRIGDCSFTSDGHHGTPLQRMAAARAGYELANDAQKQGHILSAEELHQYFVSEIETIID